MQKKTIGKIFKWIRILILVYIIIGIALFYLQEKLIFHPKKLDAGYVYKFPIPFQETNIDVSNEKVVGVVRFTVPDSIRKGVVLYFHGNRQNIERYAPFATNFTRNNYEVWMIDYPGYGKSTGPLTEAIMYSDGIELYKMARALFSKDSIIIYGKSLGCGVATKVASLKECKRVILETPYYSLDDVTSHFAPIYPVSLFSKYHFPVNEYIERIDAPITILHGSSDGVILFSQSRHLQKIKPGIELVRIEKGSHNDLNDFPLFHRTIDSLLQQ
ncbi:MAG: alpha/beta hydrolase [Chitinophagaceae bacterium]